MGALDELNSFLGLCRAHMQDRGLSLEVLLGNERTFASTLVRDM